MLQHNNITDSMEFSLKGYKGLKSLGFYPGQKQVHKRIPIG